MREKKMRNNENAGCGKCGKGKCGTRLQGLKTQEKKMRHKISGVENAGKVACVIKLKQHKVNDKRVK